MIYAFHIANVIDVIRDDTAVTGVHTMLRNPYYVGIMRWKGVDYPAVHPLFVSQETFDKVQTVLATNRNGPSNAKSWRHKQALKDYLRCGRCKHLMGYTMAKSSGNGQHYPYWYCLGRTKYRNGCEQKYIAADKIETAVCNYYNTIVIAAERAVKLSVLVSRGFDKAVASQQKQAELQRRRLGSLTRERDKLLQLYYDDAIESDQFKAEQARIKHERAAATKAITVITGTANEAIAKLGALDLMTSCGEAYRRAGYPGRRKLNAGLIDAFYVVDEKIDRADLTKLFSAFSDDRVIKGIKQEVEGLEQAADDELDLAFQQMVAKIPNPDLLSQDRGSNIFTGLIRQISNFSL